MSRTVCMLALSGTGCCRRKGRLPALKVRAGGQVFPFTVCFSRVAGNDFPPRPCTRGRGVGGEGDALARPQPLSPAYRGEGRLIAAVRLTYNPEDGARPKPQEKRA